MLGARSPSDCRDLPFALARAAAQPTCGEGCVQVRSARASSPLLSGLNSEGVIVPHFSRPRLHVGDSLWRIFTLGQQRAAPSYLQACGHGARAFDAPPLGGVPSTGVRVPVSHRPGSRSSLHPPAADGLSRAFICRGEKARGLQSPRGRHVCPLVWGDVPL